MIENTTKEPRADAINSISASRPEPVKSPALKATYIKSVMVIPVRTAAKTDSLRMGIGWVVEVFANCPDSREIPESWC